jgi:hypothetical protein
MPSSESPHIETAQGEAELQEGHCQKTDKASEFQCYRKAKDGWYAQRSRTTSSGLQKSAILCCLVSYGVGNELILVVE